MLDILSNFRLLLLQLLLETSLRLPPRRVCILRGRRTYSGLYAVCTLSRMRYCEPCAGEKDVAGQGFLDAERSARSRRDARGISRLPTSCAPITVADIGEHRRCSRGHSRATRIEYVTLPRVCPGVRCVRKCISPIWTITSVFHDSSTLTGANMNPSRGRNRFVRRPPRTALSPSVATPARRLVS